MAEQVELLEGAIPLMPWDGLRLSPVAYSNVMIQFWTLRRESEKEMMESRNGGMLPVAQLKEKTQKAQRKPCLMAARFLPGPRLPGNKVEGGV